MHGSTGWLPETRRLDPPGLETLHRGHASRETELPGIGKGAARRYRMPRGVPADLDLVRFADQHRDDRRESCFLFVSQLGRVVGKLKDRTDAGMFAVMEHHQSGLSPPGHRHLAAALASSACVAMRLRRLTSVSSSMAPYGSASGSATCRLIPVSRILKSRQRPSSILALGHDPHDQRRPSLR